MEVYDKIRSITKRYSLKNVLYNLTLRSNIVLSPRTYDVFKKINIFNTITYYDDHIVIDGVKYVVDNPTDLRDYILLAPDALHLANMDIDEEWDDEVYDEIMELDNTFDLVQQLKLLSCV